MIPPSNDPDTVFPETVTLLVVAPADAVATTIPATSGPTAVKTPGLPVIVFPEIVPPLIDPPVLWVEYTMPHPAPLLEMTLLLTVTFEEATGEPGPGFGTPGSIGPLSFTKIPPAPLPVTVLPFTSELVTPANAMAPLPGRGLAVRPFPFTVEFLMVTAVVCST